MAFKPPENYKKIRDVVSKDVVGSREYETATPEKKQKMEEFQELMKNALTHLNDIEERAVELLERGVEPEDVSMVVSELIKKGSASFEYKGGIRVDRVIPALENVVEQMDSIIEKRDAEFEARVAEQNVEAPELKDEYKHANIGYTLGGNSDVRREIDRISKKGPTREQYQLIIIAAISLLEDRNSKALDKLENVNSEHKGEYIAKDVAQFIKNNPELVKSRCEQFGALSGDGGAAEKYREAAANLQ